ncbi:LysR family transcriptional regulator [Serratia fonticola]|uniref:LysR family transcriptional regulator n=1 Tax=Serratia fonticola TaxID=47917 RepID=UPI002DB61640|nr:LysR family transcriptional regulator [Serratia fonticola]MEB7885834.1 LysR family transcriptional regulator [Serratia fonticola]
MDKLGAMATFTRVTELGSLSAAARDLQLSQPAVSQQITSLEQQLGVLLLYRTTRSVTLTEAGQRYYQQIKSVLAAVAEAEETLQGVGHRLQGNLRIHAPSGFGQRHLTPLVIAFQQQHPELNIELLLTDSIADVVGEGIDVAIRFGELQSPGTVARRLGEVQRVLVASPSYLARYGTPNTLSELSQHPHIRYSGLAGNSLTLSGAHGIEMVNVRTVFRANNTFALLAAMESGLGIGGAQVPLIGEALTQGRLTMILTDYLYPPLPVHAVYPATRFIPAKVRAWVDFLAKAMMTIEGITPSG